MSGYDFKVPARSWANVRAETEKLRAAFGLEDTPSICVMTLLEQVMFNQFDMVRLEIWDRADMNGNEGETCPKGEFIRLAEDVYEKAYQGDGCARFTVAHEVGHWHMHTNVPLGRVRPGERIPGYLASEAQANQYAAELLMPPKFFTPNDSVMDVMMRHGVSGQAASYRLEYLKGKGLI